MRLSCGWPRLLSLLPASVGSSHIPGNLPVLSWKDIKCRCATLAAVLHEESSKCQPCPLPTGLGGKVQFEGFAQDTPLHRAKCRSICFLHSSLPKGSPKVWLLHAVSAHVLKVLKIGKEALENMRAISFVPTRRGTTALMRFC